MASRAVETIAGDGSGDASSVAMFRRSEPSDPASATSVGNVFLRRARSLVGFPVRSASPQIPRMSSRTWNPNPIANPKSAIAATFSDDAPATCAPIAVAQEISAADFLAIMSRYASGVTCAKPTNSRSRC